jgi:hypothetical protein
LSFTDSEKKYEIWKYSKVTNDGIAIETTMYEVSKNNREPTNENFQDVFLGFSALKTAVFNELLLWNGEYESQSFKSLHAKTRGVFDLLNITKLANEIKKNKILYIDLLEK